ncbi:cytochrome P450 [Punctularia strigosozonata HHB-11173 SS5]|uniref:Cytochrome P450 n=1 Tax=Punctularia strigosozonata (strain HHB-11173) TaxID=741275 RepID=R7S428_PUNST|nr:cytochrome P450 [Punctularia strigosozonata HHB-11173 SS5]EIN04552.1 cytochrome P450 [Punctularia strigosozonata HHB-11173 SS5]
MTLVNILAGSAASIVAYVVWRALAEIWERKRSPLRKLQGPASPSWAFGNFAQLLTGDTGRLQDSWLQQYGKTMKVSGFFNRDRLFTVDPRALNHILTHSTDFQKPEVGRYNLGRIVGEGLLIAEGDAHRRQRRVMNPGFGPAQVRELTGVFLDKAALLRDAWLAEARKNGTAAPTRIDALAWLSRATLDIIGLAGFNYSFDSLEGGKPNELNEAMATMFSATEGSRFWTLLQARIPILRKIPTERDRTIEYAQNTMKRIGYALISERKAAIRAEKHGAHVEKGDVQGRDLLSLLIKSNMAVDIPEEQRLSDHDILSQIPTFMVAGHETTSTGTTWALFALTQNQDVQRKLREELLSVPIDTPTMDELNALPYLDAVIRETLRVHAPVSATTRVAMKDEVIPVSEPYTDKDGNVHHEIRVNKGDYIQIPIVAVNRASHIWGSDAHEFKPERWLEPSAMPEAPSHNPGVWGNMLSFLGGPRSCIGYRFSLVEMKALLFVLVRAFEFELAVPASEISKKSAVVTRPNVKSEPKKGNQLPILIKPYVADAEA